jgi:hypothetical protein
MKYLRTPREKNHHRTSLQSKRPYIIPHPSSPPHRVPPPPVQTMRPKTAPAPMQLPLGQERHQPPPQHGTDRAREREGEKEKGRARQTATAPLPHGRVPGRPPARMPGRPMHLCLCPAKSQVLPPFPPSLLRRARAVRRRRSRLCCVDGGNRERSAAMRLPLLPCGQYSLDERKGGTNGLKNGF